MVRVVTPGMISNRIDNAASRVHMVLQNPPG
jgi:hypothetical protein